MLMVIVLPYDLKTENAYTFKRGARSSDQRKKVSNFWSHDNNNNIEKSIFCKLKHLKKINDTSRTRTCAGKSQKISNLSP